MKDGKEEKRRKEEEKEFYLMPHRRISPSLLPVLFFPQHSRLLSSKNCEKSLREKATQLSLFCMSSKGAVKKKIAPTATKNFFFVAVGAIFFFTAPFLFLWLLVQFFFHRPLVEQLSFFVAVGAIFFSPPPCRALFPVRIRVAAALVKHRSICPKLRSCLPSLGTADNFCE